MCWRCSRDVVRAVDCTSKMVTCLNSTTSFPSRPRGTTTSPTNRYSIDTATTRNTATQPWGMHDQHHGTEEPDEVKVCAASLGARYFLQGREVRKTRPPGHPPYLDAKARGESSMVGKRGTQRRR